MIRLETNTNETGGVDVMLEMHGSTDALIDELAAAAAHAVVMLADSLPTQDDLHESLARTLSEQVLHYCSAELAARDGQAVDGTEGA